MGQEEILHTKEEKDLGVLIQDTLSPEQHINQLFGSTYRILSNIRVAFHHMDKDMMKNILTSMIHLRLEYATVWSPNKKGYKEIRKDPKSNHKNPIQYSVFTHVHIPLSSSYCIQHTLGITGCLRSCKALLAPQSASCQTHPKRLGHNP